MPQIYISSMWETYLLALVKQMAMTLGIILGVGILLHLSSMFLQRKLTVMLGSRMAILLTAPGTVVHELGHALFCPIFAHRIQQVRFFQMGSDGVLGFVKHVYNPRNPWAILGNFWISTGPLWLGGTLLLVILSVLGVEDVRQIQWTEPANWLLVYLFLAIGSQMGLSMEDLRASWGSLLLFLILWMGLGLAMMWFGYDLVQFLYPLEDYSMLIAWILIPVAFLNGLFGIVLMVLSRVLK